jgi:hypothetical protein
MDEQKIDGYLTLNLYRIFGNKIFLLMNLNDLMSFYEEYIFILIQRL